MSIPWPQFRTQLFAKIEERRARAAMFRFEQIYWFIGRCSKLVGNPGTREAQQALEAIANEGTFLLVADSLTEFGDIVAAAQTEEPANATSNDRAARPGPQSPVSPPQQPTQNSHVNADARQSSGHPFRR